MSPTEPRSRPQTRDADPGRRVSLVVGGRAHDFDYVRSRLSNMIADQGHQVWLETDYSDHAALRQSDLLVSYVCDVRPPAADQAAVADFVASGGRWFALHGTNAILERTPAGIETPDLLGVLSRVLGSRFLAHPPVHTFRVEVSASSHRLLDGVAPFSICDELYLCDFIAAEHNLPLLTARWVGDTGAGPDAFVRRTWPADDPRPLMYLRPFGLGEVLYLTLGHRDPPAAKHNSGSAAESVMCSPWQNTNFIRLLENGIDWGTSPR